MSCSQRTKAQDIFVRNDLNESAAFCIQKHFKNKELFHWSRKVIRLPAPNRIHMYRKL